MSDKAHYRGQIEKLLSSPALHGSESLCKLLRYLFAYKLGVFAESLPSITPLRAPTIISWSISRGEHTRSPFMNGPQVQAETTGVRSMIRL